MSGRGTYNEVINQTNDEQVLNVIVRQRYDETFGIISVASITANLKFAASIGWNVGFGNAADYAGNLVPLSGGVGYEENPTISYIPLSGEDFVRRMLSPIPVSEWSLLNQFSLHEGNMPIMGALHINGLQNHLLSGKPASPEFLRFIDLLAQLKKAGVLETGQASINDGKKHIFWDIHDYQDAHRDNLREFLDLIGIQVKLDGSRFRLPILDAVGKSDSAVHISTRSAYSLLRVFGTGIEIPPPHLEAGFVEPLKSGLPEDRRIITIHSSKERPDNATVRIRFRDWWFYIDASDRVSKRSFTFLRTVISMSLKDPSAHFKAPIITVPVN